MTEILLKVALNTITLTLLILFKSSCNFESDIKHHSSNHYQLIKIGGVILVLRDQALTKYPKFSRLPPRDAIFFKCAP